MINKEELLNYLLDKVNAFEMDHYSEYTYAHSKGYRKCLMDILGFITDLK